MGKKFYAVRRGKVAGIFETWDECKDSVHGYPGAQYKSFGTLAEAEAYLGGAGAGNGGSCGESLCGGSESGKSACGGRRKTAKLAAGCGKSSAGTGSEAGGSAEQRRSVEGELVAYVDGSFNAATKEFSYGVVLLLEGEDLCFNEKMADPELAQMHNVAGEIKGAEAAMRYGLEHGYNKVVIHHDYEGIAKWCLGQWKTNKEGTKAYKAFYDSIKDKLKVDFIKVTGHSNDKYNDVADLLAKEALGIR